MTYAIVRKGDTNTSGGRATKGRSSVKSSGVELATYRSSVSKHPCCGRPGCDKHCNAKITGGNSKVHAEGQPVHTVKDSDSCSHKRSRGDKKVVVY